tara:strand:- start:2798 stop:3619 length:822 start_codon:yes stop_codon:yes gene_type:complete
VDLTQERLALWKENVKVSLSKDDKGYNVTGDERIEPDKVLPRVTSILNVIDKPALRTWAMDQALAYIKEQTSGHPVVGSLLLDNILENAPNAHRKKRDTAANYGTEAHALLQYLCIDSEIAIPDKFLPVVTAWNKWMAESGLRIIDTEVAMYYHNNIAFAGTADLIAVDSDGYPVIVDYKTGAHIYREAALQMGAYSMALAYCNNSYQFFSYEQIEQTRAIVIRLPKEEGELPEIKEVADIMKHQAAFTHACKLRQWMSSRDKWVRKPRAVRG